MKALSIEGDTPEWSNEAYMPLADMPQSIIGPPTGRWRGRGDAGGANIFCPVTVDFRII
jgi:hypothetical protein